MNGSDFNNFIEQCLEGSNRIKITWLRENNYAAVPIPTPINLLDAEWLENACQKRNISICYGIDTFKPTFASIMSFSPKRDEIISFLRKNESTNAADMLIFSETLNFAYLHTEEDYTIISGEIHFVRECIGCSFQTARKVFDEYAEDTFTMDQKHKDALKAIGNMYRPFGHD